MIKNKYLVIGGSLIAILIISGISLFVWQGSKHSNLQSSNTGSEANYGDGSQSLSQATKVDGVPINGDPKPTPSNAGIGLRVATNTPGNNLGQLGPNGANSSGQPTNNSSSPKPTSSPFDPSTFAQYDKYKDGEAALFGEVQAGNGAELTANKKAAVYYKGWLTNGKMFDQTRADDKGQVQPFVFTLGAHQVIPGWEQAIAGMKVGGTRMMIIPPKVGYGAAGQPPIPPNSVLIFEVQLLAVE